MGKVLNIEDIELAFRINQDSAHKNAYDQVVFEVNTLWRRNNYSEWSDLRISNVVCLGDHRISDLEDFIRNSTIPDEEKESILQQRTLDFNKLSRLFDKHTDQFLIFINQWFDEAYWVEKKEIKRYLKQWLETGGLDRIDFELGEDNLYHISFRCRNEYVLICGSQNCLVM